MTKKAENTVDQESTAAAEERTALVVVGKATAADGGKTNPGGSLDRDLALAEVEKEKNLSFIQAWEQSEISKAMNKAQKKLSTVTAWENSQKASKEADLRKTEEQLDKKKAEYGEKMRNKVVLIHKQADEKRAVIHATQGEEILKAKELSAKYRATGSVPKKFLGCFQFGGFNSVAYVWAVQKGLEDVYRLLLG